MIPKRDRDLLFGTVDTWIAWVVSGGTLHVTDHTNAGVTGLYDMARTRLVGAGVRALGVPMRCCRRSSTPVRRARRRLRSSPGAPMIGGLVGDQQASLIGQGCVRPGMAKVTFGTGGMLDMCTGGRAPVDHRRSRPRHVPDRRLDPQRQATWGVEAIMLSAGSNVDWLRDDLQIIPTSAESHDVASQCDVTDGVQYVPALLGLGDAEVGLRRARHAPRHHPRHGPTAASSAPCWRASPSEAPISIEAAEADTGLDIPVLRIDGGMSENPTFVQALAECLRKGRSRCRPSPKRPRSVPATSPGSPLVRGRDLDEVADSWSPATVVEPSGSFDRDRWRLAVERSSRWIPDLSALDF